MNEEIVKAEKDLETAKQRATIAKSQVAAMYERENELRDKLQHTTKEVNKSQVHFCNAMTQATAAVEKLKEAYIKHAEKLGSV